MENPRTSSKSIPEEIPEGVPGGVPQEIKNNPQKAAGEILHRIYEGIP